MARYAALLRGVNVGGNKKVPMASLREVVEGLGHTDVKTVLQSGNVVFTAAKESAPLLAAAIERAIADEIGVSSKTFVLTGADLRRAIDSNPFAEAASKDPSHLLLSFLSKNVAPAALGALDDKFVKGEELAVVGSVLYVWYRDGVGTSKLTGAVIEKALAVDTTARNWNTVIKLADLVLGSA